ncbi:MAG: STAS domain-containing protein [Bacteroidia bacterium]|nr:STAS domain-containing protein [Bacteroidia bacterium]NND10907.1 STAS domain-containing protein [Flavobacteriaceae bacterium]NNK28159.1 STAS domain-containing protein [Flavobacteriaceae bacterium]RZV62029.1 MAG: STAS domain-containing protein [Flavobacteriaceae bacterium]
MGLQIIDLQDCYQVKGELNKANVDTFSTYFKEVIRTADEVTINIEELDSIDRVGVNALVKLYAQSLENQSKFFIVGLGSKELHEHFRAVESAA